MVSFYKSLFRRNIVLRNLVAVILQYFFLSALHLIGAICPPEWNSKYSFSTSPITPITHNVLNILNLATYEAHINEIYLSECRIYPSGDFLMAPAATQSTHYLLIVLLVQAKYLKLDMSSTYLLSPSVNPFIYRLCPYKIPMARKSSRGPR